MLLIGNWKMAPEKLEQAHSLAKVSLAAARKYKKTLTVLICPPAVHIASLQKTIKEPLLIGAQDVSTATAVANTGLISAGQLAGVGAQYAIVGHSESRARGDTNELVLEKVVRLFEKKITPIVCVGEKKRDVQGWYLSEVKDQIDLLLTAIPKASFKKIVIAYEPLWAIGEHAEREATPAECLEMVIYIRKLINDVYGKAFANSMTIVYGGSVNESNAKEFITNGGADGLLVGRVSLDPKRFTALAGAIA